MSDFDLGYRDPLWAKLEQKDAEIERLEKTFLVRASKEVQKMIADKDAEIERLSARCAFMASNDYVYSLTSEIERLKDENDGLRAEWHAEIERSKRYAEGYEKIIAVRDAEIVQFKGLLVRAADTLESNQIATSKSCEIFTLITELRKAAQ